MWARRSHLLQLLTALKSNKAKIKMTDVEQQSFDKIKRIVAHDTLFIYSYLYERSDIHEDTSDFQLGAVII